ncbi:hypothetical protein HDU76_008409 [Blyttiomyces sp. JEL0837]|nr:hypothetical protein HDU76_008409 [Blyttiomyces sp. JEL0837]
MAASTAATLNLKNATLKQPTLTIEQNMSPSPAEPKPTVGSAPVKNNSIEPGFSSQTFFWGGLELPGSAEDLATEASVVDKQEPKRNWKRNYSDELLTHIARRPISDELGDPFDGFALKLMNLGHRVPTEEEMKTAEKEVRRFEKIGDALTDRLKFVLEERGVHEFKKERRGFISE